MPRREPLYPHVPKSHRQSDLNKPIGAEPPNLEVKRYHGVIVRIGECDVKDPRFPDWNLSYIEYPAGQLDAYRNVTILKEGIRKVKVTKQRIYFEEVD